MRLRSVAPRAGAQWVHEGIRTFFKRPVAFAAMMGVLVVGVVLVRLLPALVVLVLPLTPLVTLAFMIATRTVRQGGSPTVQVFLEPLRADRKRVVALVRLGLIYAAATFVIMWLGNLVGNDSGDTLLEAAPAATAASAGGGAVSSAATSPGLVVMPGAAFGLLLQLAFIGLLSLPFWHAPALVYWEGQGCAQALFSSTLACWRNRGAFLVYGLVWFGYVMAISLVVGLFVGVLGQPDWLMAASAPMSLIVAALFYPSLYFTFADSFAASEEEASPGAIEQESV